MNTQRVILDAAIEGSVIRGTLTSPSSERREFHGWLELNTALEAMIGRGADHRASFQQAPVTAPSNKLSPKGRQ
jgi:hypothetical protein